MLNFAKLVVKRSEVLLIKELLFSDVAVNTSHTHTRASKYSTCMFNSWFYCLQTRHSKKKDNDPSAGSPMETLLRLLFCPNNQHSEDTRLNFLSPPEVWLTTWISGCFPVLWLNNCCKCKSIGIVININTCSHNIQVWTWYWCRIFFIILYT